MKRVATVFLSILVSACGPLNDDRGTPELLNQFRSQLGGQDETAAPTTLPPEIASAGPGEVLVVTLRARNAVAPMVRLGENGNRTTWVSPGKVSMTFQDDLLISTRGLGDDLMGADVEGIRTAITEGNGTVARRHSYLNSLDQIETIDLTCEYASNGEEDVALLGGVAKLRKVTETCKSSRLVFENTYWLDGDQIAKSRQAISPSQGYIDAEPL